jgi:hypothetical protein
LHTVAIEALQSLLQTSLVPDRETFASFTAYYGRGKIETTPCLLGVLRTMERAAIQKAQHRRYGKFDSSGIVIWLRCLVPISWFGSTGFQASDACKDDFAVATERLQ